MRMAEAEKMMGKKTRGYRVSYDERDGVMLKSGFFPERDEAPIETEVDAWAMADRFARNAPPQFVNIYVIYADDFTPVIGYAVNTRRRYPPR